MSEREKQFEEQHKEPKTPQYKILGESGLVEDEEGNIYSVNEVFPSDKPSKPITFPHFQRNSFVSELDNKCNPAYWFYYYDERYCGPNREAWMEEMAAKHRKMRKKGIATSSLYDTTPISEPEPDCAYHLCEATKAHADLEQNEVIRLGIHPTFRKDFSYMRGLGFTAVVDKFGNVIISNEKYEMVGHYNYGLAMAQDRKTKLFGFVDRHGREVVRCKWRSVGVFSEYMAGVQNTDRKCGYIDVKGFLAIPCKWEEVWPFYEGIAIVQDNKRLGLINQSGKLIAPCIWKKMGGLSEGLISVMDKSGKWGFIDKMGNVVIPCRWKRVNNFHKGYAKVSASKRSLFFKDRWVYIDRNGNIVKEE
jgi:hypothetical protein